MQVSTLESISGSWPMRKQKRFSKSITSSLPGVLTIMRRQDLAWLNLEINSAFNQEWIVIEHLLVVSSHKLILNVVATVMQTACTNIATCPFQTVSFRFHLWIVTVFDGLCESLKWWVKRKHFKLAKHLIEDLRLVAKKYDSFLYVYGHIDWEVYNSVHLVS